MQDPRRDPREADRLSPDAATRREIVPAGAAGRSYCGRFAPSPTGPLHLGSLFTALASYLQARSRQGTWLLRIDDLDSARVVPGATDAILKTLEGFALNWDGNETYQSTRLEHYQEATRHLLGMGLLYACSCSRKSLAGARRYPGHCRHGSRPANAGHALRFTADGCIVRLHDGLQGDYLQDFGEEVGDFVVLRRDGVHAYHLATVVDDADAGVTEVMRGVDLLESTPRQMLLQRALSLPTPRYLHVPVLVDASGSKLSKQTGAAAVGADRASATLCNLLGLMGMPPPPDLAGAPAATLLAWAVGRWEPDALRGRALQV